MPKRARAVESVAAVAVVVVNWRRTSTILGTKVFDLEPWSFEGERMTFALRGKGCTKRVDRNLEHEHHLKSLIKASRELVTFVHEPQPGQIAIVPYPFDDDGPIDPSRLVAYSRTHSFEVPRCFHNLTARIFQAGTKGAFAGKFCVACPFKKASGYCQYWQCITDLLDADVDGAVTYMAYGKRSPSDVMQRRLLAARKAADLIADPAPYPANFGYPVQTWAHYGMEELLKIPDTELDVDPSDQDTNYPSDSLFSSSQEASATSSSQPASSQSSGPPPVNSASQYTGPVLDFLRGVPENAPPPSNDAQSQAQAPMSLPASDGAVTPPTPAQRVHQDSDGITDASYDSSGAPEQVSSAESEAVILPRNPPRNLKRRRGNPRPKVLPVAHPQAPQDTQEPTQPEAGPSNVVQGHAQHEVGEAPWDAAKHIFRVPEGGVVAALHRMDSENLNT
ncbi:hypothetical protein SCHPADRAFT_930768 [Schizopora paradoxa]|uniref:Uncharacterized protein n=1 Tax=Schizopora paradoxa TaxID=27342 RepID=A0A0H2RDW9_9AGAM|nr:hypothetical protein SCHPADRAFT_930768 [Schizopora paradoxa]